MVPLDSDRGQGVPDWNDLSVGSAIVLDDFSGNGGWVFNSYLFNWIHVGGGGIVSVFQFLESVHGDDADIGVSG